MRTVSINFTHKAVAGIALLILFGAAYSVSANTITFSDDFNRPDSQIVGNGWSPVDQFAGQLSISGGKLIDADSSGVVGAVYRPISHSGPITIAADFSHESGFGGLPNRYQTMFAVRADGSGKGYGINFDRGDVNFPSYIDLLDNGVLVAEIGSSFAFGPQMHAVITFNPDGSISGTVSQPGDSYDFSFPARTVVSAGENIMIRMGEFNVSPGGTIMPWVDNFQVTTDVDDPTPQEQIANLIGTVVDYSFPKNVENSYLANLSKIETLLGEGNIQPALNQLSAFVQKVEQDYAHGVILESERDVLIQLAETLLAQLSQ